MSITATVSHPGVAMGSPSGLLPEVAADLSSVSNDYLESEVAVLSAQLDAAEHRLLTLIRELDRRERHRDHGRRRWCPPGCRGGSDSAGRRA